MAAARAADQAATTPESTQRAGDAGNRRQSPDATDNSRQAHFIFQDVGVAQHYSKPVDSALNLSCLALSRTTPMSASEKPEGVSASISRVIFTLVLGLR